jgi:Ulp1 family protease
MLKKAAVGLPLCDTGDDFTCSQLITNQLDKSVGRNHLQTITQFDRDSLKDATYINDVIIDFWLLWLSRNSSHDSLEYFFYVTLLYNIG